MSWKNTLWSPSKVFFFMTEEDAWKIKVDNLSTILRFLTCGGVGSVCSGDGLHSLPPPMSPVSGGSRAGPHLKRGGFHQWRVPVEAFGSAEGRRTRGERVGSPVCPISPDVISPQRGVSSRLPGDLASPQVMATAAASLYAPCLAYSFKQIVAPSPLDRVINLRNLITYPLITCSVWVTGLYTSHFHDN